MVLRLKLAFLLAVMLAAQWRVSRRLMALDPVAELSDEPHPEGVL